MNDMDIFEQAADMCTTYQDLSVVACPRTHTNGSLAWPLFGDWSLISFPFGPPARSPNRAHSPCSRPRVEFAFCGNRRSAKLV